MSIGAPPRSAPAGPTVAAPSLRVVGEMLPRVDGRALVTGSPVYTVDLDLPDMLHGKILHSPLAHARIVAIDTSAARSLPGVQAVLTHRDVPATLHATAGVPFPELSPYDTRLLDPHLRYAGDWVALVAAESEAIAEAAVALIKVTYEELPAVFDPSEAMLEGAPQLHEPDLTHPRFGLSPGPAYDARHNLAGHEEIWRGADFATTMAAADHVITGTYRTQRVAHCALEPHVAVAHLDGYDRLNVWSSTQVPYHTRRQLAAVLGWPVSRLRVIKLRVGGGFGGKQEMLLEPAAAVLAIATGRPVRVLYSRREEFAASRVRHPMTVRMRSGVTSDGRLLALEMHAIADTGAYGGHGLTVAQAAGHKTLCLYRASAYHFVADAVYTNSPVSGAMRGYGAPQGYFALESHMDEIAATLGLDPLELRRRNHVRRGDYDPINLDLSSGVPRPGRHFRSCGLPECLTRGADAIGWDRPFDRGHGAIRRGRGMAIAMQGSGVAGSELGGASIKMNEDGSFNVMTGATDIGQGSDTVLAQIAAETLGVELDKIVMHSSDTDIDVFDYGSYASSTTFVSGTGVQRAAEAVRDQILAVAADMTGRPADELRLEGGLIHTATGALPLTMADVASETLYGSRRQQIMASGHASCHDSPPPFHAQFVEIAVDCETGQIRVERSVNVIDLGRAINPQLASGQVEGAIAMGLGFALSEELLLDEHGQVRNPAFVDYKVLSCLDMPAMTTILVEDHEPTGPFGAKSCGEVPINTPGPAVANALFDALGIRLRSLPLTAEKVLAALSSRDHAPVRSATPPDDHPDPPEGGGDQPLPGGPGPGS
ncbi:MAG: xanthine dehydrogenase family protein molybdopterin-binding subunit [Candidatus Dormibacteria bacterium]